VNQTNNKNSKLSDATKNYYENLIGNIGDEYIDFRWKKHPVSRSHYNQTKKSIVYIFNNINMSADRMLEIGSGPGTWTDICLQHTKELTIADISSEMLKLVSKKFSSASIKTVCGDFCSNEVSFEQSFDAIFSARALEYFDNKRAMVKKCTSILNKNGSLIIITKNPTWMDKQRDIRNAKNNDEHNIQKDWIDWKTLESYYKEFGLKNIMTLPVCFGSYYFPLNTVIGIKLCDIFHDKLMKNCITSNSEKYVESYMTIGQR